MRSRVARTGQLAEAGSEAAATLAAGAEGLLGRLHVRPLQVEGRGHGVEGGAEDVDGRVRHGRSGRHEGQPDGEGTQAALLRRGEAGPRDVLEHREEREHLHGTGLGSTRGHGTVAGSGRQMA